MKIICVGMNYAEHNRELDKGFNAGEKPVIFMKPDSALLKNRRPFFLPGDMGRIDYEAELVVRINKLGKSISEKFAMRYVDAVTVGIDFTARDMQDEARAKGLPWDLCKGFDNAAVLGDWVSLDRIFRNPDDLSFRLDIDGKTVQTGYTGDMIYSIPRIIEYVSSFCTLKTGDMIFTGTPAGVGPVSIDQHLQGFLEGQNVLDFHIR